MLAWIHENCVKDSLCFEMAKGIPAAFIALIIGLIAAGITWRQYRVAEAKLKLDLFEKRLKIYQNTMRLLHTAITTHIEQPLTIVSDIIEMKPEARFLFGQSIVDYLDTISTNAFEFLELRAKENPYEPVGKNKHLMELLTWLLEQRQKGCLREYAKYLDLARWK